MLIKESEGSGSDGLIGVIVDDQRRLRAAATSMATVDSGGSGGHCVLARCHVGPFRTTRTWSPSAFGRTDPAGIPAARARPASGIPTPPPSPASFYLDKESYYRA